MVLVVGLPVAEDGVTRELNAEFGSKASGLGNEFAVTIEKILGSPPSFLGGSSSR